MLLNLKEWRIEIERFLTGPKTVPLYSKEKVLDIGLGESSMIAERYCPHLMVLDKMTHQGRKFIYGDIMDRATIEHMEGQWDTVICCEVFEHTEDFYIAAENVESLVKPGGHIIVTVPCFLPWHPGEPYYGDYHRFMPSSLENLFGKERVKEYVARSNIKDMPYGICGVVRV